MKQAENTVKISILGAPIVVIGASPTDYPPKLDPGVLIVETTIDVENPNFVKYSGVDIPSAVGRRAVFTQTLEVGNKTNLKDLSHRGTQRSGRVTSRQLKGAVLMPTWRNTTGSTDKFVQRTKIGSKDVLLRLITNTSKNSLKVAGIEK